MNEGKTQVQIATELRISRTTLWRDLQTLSQNLNSGNLAEFEQRRNAHEAELQRMLDYLLQSEDLTDAELGKLFREYKADIAKLRGLNAESRAVVAHLTSNSVDPKTLPLYRRFIHETRWVPEEKFERIWALCRELEELPGTRPTPGPPADSELWHDDEENLLTDGGTDESA